MADQHARTPSAESYESGSGPSSQASTLPGHHTYPSQSPGGRSAYDDYSHDDLVGQPQTALVYPPAYFLIASSLSFTKQTMDLNPTVLVHVTGQPST